MRIINIVLIIFLISILIGCSINNNEEKTPLEEEKISYYGSDNDVYRINITTENEEFPNSITTYLNGSLNITEQDTSIILNNDMSMQIRARGNSTSAPEKKPFKIKFDKKQSLFGLKEAKDWVLLANYFDKTNIRNYLAYITANKFESLGFQPSSIFVDVYVNDSYQGLYMLTEQIEANKGRVDIEDITNSAGVNSFLIEADWRCQDEFEGYEGKCYIMLEGYALRFRYPNAKDYLEAVDAFDFTYQQKYENDIRWAENFLNKAIKALNAGNTSYLDIDSFIDYYFIQEFFKNVDVGSTSQYYVIRQSSSPKLACGPVWDFDISSGVVDSSYSGEYEYYTNSILYVREVDSLYKILFQNKEFEERAKERYEEIRHILAEVFEEIITIKNALAKAQIRNLEKWPFPTERQYWIEKYAMSITYFELKSLSTHYRHLKDTLEQRLTILDKYYL